jgi:hypothetical protein
MEVIMGAIAVSKVDELLVERLRKELETRRNQPSSERLSGRSRKKTDDERVRREVEESVRRCRAADRLENLELLPGAVTKRTARS